MPSIILPSRLDLPRNGLVGYYTQRGPGNTGYLDHIAGRVSTFTNNGISWRSIDRMPKYLVQPVITSGGEHSLQRNARLGEPITIIAYANTYDASLFVEITDEFFFGLYPYGMGYPIFRRTKSGGGGNISHHVSENWKDKTAVFAVSHSGNLADTAKFYVDGQPKTTTVETSDTGAAAVTTNPVRLTPYRGGWPSSYNAGLPVLAIYNRELPAAEIRALSSKQFPSTLATCRRVLYFETAGGGTTVEPSAGNYAYSGAAPTISQPIAVAPVVGGYSYVGNTPVVSQSTSISPTAGGYSYTGNTPSLSQPVTVAPTTGAYAYLGNTPEIIQAAGIYPTAGEYTYAGNTPAISQPRAIAPAVGAYEYLGNVPSVLQIATIQPDAGTIIYTGNTPSISQPRAIAPQDGSYAYAGGVPGVTQTTTTLTAADLAAIWDDIEIEPGISPRMALRILLAAVGGKRVGLGTATEQYMAQDGTTPRITFSPTDAAGNGTPIVDGS